MIGREPCISNVIAALRPRKTNKHNQANRSTFTDRKVSAKSYKKRFNKFKRTFKKHGLIYANAILILAVTAVVWSGHNGASSEESNSRSILSTPSSVNAADGPVDTLSSADIAANIAQAVSISEGISVANQADSYNAQLTQATTEQAVVTKPQIVTSSAKSRKDIITYTAKEGDTLSSLAQKFGITSDTIRWSNGLTAEFVPAGKSLMIAPRNGIIYKTQSGDTVDSLSAKYQSNKEQIVTFNDIELSGLPVGEYILLPDAQQPVQPRATTTTRTATTNNSSTNSVNTYGFVARYGGNGYVYGYCTYYAAGRAGVPANWGNANTWDNYARLSGWTVSSKPIVGAVFQTDNGWAGHVGIVEEVSPDGAQIRISDMNGIAGYGRVGYSGWIPVSTYPNYIYR